MAEPHREATDGTVIAGYVQFPVVGGKPDELQHYRQLVGDLVHVVALNTTLTDTPHLVRVVGVAEREGEDRLSSASAQKKPLLDFLEKPVPDVAPPSTATAARSLVVVEESVRGVSLQALCDLTQHHGRRAMKTNELRIIARDVLTSLAHLHSHARIAHGHVSPDAILIDATAHRARLRGSPFAREAPQGHTIRRSPLLDQAVRACEVARTAAAAVAEQLYWCAPEALTAGTIDLHTQRIRSVGFTADLYALGATLIYAALPSRADAIGNDRILKSSTAATTGAGKARTMDATLEQRVRACVAALQRGRGRSGYCPDERSADCAALRSIHGSDLIAFLSRCVAQEEAHPPSACILLEDSFLRKSCHDAAAETEEREVAVMQLLATVKSCQRDGKDFKAPANTPTYWSLPLGVTDRQKAASTSLSLQSQESTCTADVRTFRIPTTLRSAVLASATAVPSMQTSPATLADDGDDAGEGNANAAPVENSPATLLPTDAAAESQTQMTRQACRTALLSALHATKVAVQQHPQRKQQQPRSGVGAEDLDLSKRPPWLSSCVGSPCPQPYLAPVMGFGRAIPATALSLRASSPGPHAGSARGPPVFATSTLANSPAALAHAQSSFMLDSPSGIPGADASVGTSSPARHSRSGGVEKGDTTPAGVGEDTSRAQTAEQLLDVMAREVRALTALSPDFAAVFCESFAAAATANIEELACCVNSVDDFVPRLTRKDSSWTATADACLSRRPKSVKKLDLRRPLRTAEEWAQVPSMPREPVHPQSLATALTSVGGGAAAMLYNKWLKSHQKGSGHNGLM